MRGKQAAAFRNTIDSELRMVLDAYRGFPEQGESLAIRLPIARRMSIPLQAELWETLFKLNLKKLPAVPSAVIDLSGDPDGPAALTLCWRDIAREDGRLFAGKVDNYENVENLVPATPPAASGGEIDPEVSIEDWIASFGEA